MESAEKTEDTYLNEIRIEKQKLRKEKQKMFDERTALNKVLREQARKESLVDIMKNVIDQYERTGFTYEPKPIEKSENDLLIHLTDVHCGVNIDSIFNVYNLEVLKSRLSQYLDEILEIKNIHKSENAYLVLGGDLIQGLIHVNARIEAKENLMEQVMSVTDVISNFIFTLSKNFNMVNVFSTPGNHSRASANKEDNVKGENFDTLILYILKKDFKAVENITVNSNLIDEGICNFVVRGHSVMASHGDKDSVNNVAWNMTKFAIKANIPLPEIIILGHRHTNGLTTCDDIKVIESGCVDGMDNYSIDKRLIGTPEQTVTVISNKHKIRCIYDIQLK